MTQALSIYTTFPDEASAAKAAQIAIERKLAACANILPGARSFYFWDGAVQDEGEVVMLLKTTAPCYEALEACLKASHPYTVPCILALPIEKGHGPYLDWLAENTGA